MGKRQLVFGFGRTCDRRPFHSQSIKRTLAIDRLWIVACDYNLQTFLIFLFLMFRTFVDKLSGMYTMPNFSYLG